MNKLDRLQKNIEQKYESRPQTHNRMTVSFSLDIDLVKRFKEHCEDRCKYISRTVEEALIIYLKKENG